MTEATKPDKTRQLSIEQANAIEHLLQGQSDRAVAEAVGVSRQTVSEWKNHDPLFIAELNRQRSEMWREARERMKVPGQSCTGRGGAAAWQQRAQGGPGRSQVHSAGHPAPGRYRSANRSGPTTPEAVILERLRGEARKELIANEPTKPRYLLEFDPLREINEVDFENKVEDLAKSRLKKAMAEAGLS